jgi:CubicO group peptidase (beta-lactamase class C family)
MKFILLILISVTAWAQDPLEAILNKYEGVGLSYAVVKKGKIIRTGAVGKKYLETGEALKPEHIFRIASISKSFTATALMHLQEEGKLHIEDDISKYLGYSLRHPKFPEVVITLKMLMSHTSALSDAKGYFTLDVLENEPPFHNYAPGEGYSYCNLNYNLLGSIVEKVSGTRFDQYIEQIILKPLSLTAGYRVDALPATLLTPLYAYDNGFKVSEAAYHPRREEIEKYEMGKTTPIFSPTGGMKISAPDLARYMIMHMNYGKKGIITKKSAKVMQTPVLKGYGLGLLQTDQLIPGETMVGHTGSAYGLYSMMFFHPKKKFGYVVITNGCKDCVAEPYNLMLREAILQLDKEVRK